MWWDAQQVARLLGGRVSGRNRVSAPGPGHSHNDRSLSILLDPRWPDGFTVYSHSGDDWRDCRDHVRERLGLPPWLPGQDRPAPVVNHEAPQRRWTKDDVDRINRARALWHEAEHPRGTLAEVYLQRRKLDLPDTLANTVLRFHPACPWRDDNGETIKVPVLLQAFRQINDDIITAVQRVRLDADGRKIDRRMLGVVEGAAVKLAAPDNGELAVGEGVETCLAAIQLGFKPAWSLGSCGNISSLPLIDSVDRLTLLGENDEASARAVATCGQRWQRAGRKVRVVTPNDGCGDLNDELMAVTP